MKQGWNISLFQDANALMMQNFSPSLKLFTPENSTESDFTNARKIVLGLSLIVKICGISTSELFSIVMACLTQGTGAVD